MMTDEIEGMSKNPNLYDLYGPTSLVNLERSIAEGKIPNAAELAAILEANFEASLPPWFIAMVVKSLRGKLKQRRGRPKDNVLSEIRFTVAKAKYPRYLAWLKKRQGSSGLKGWSAVRGQDMQWMRQQATLARLTNKAAVPSKLLDES